MSVIRITIDLGGAQVSIRERLHASIASGQPLSGRKLHTRVPLGIPVALPVWQPVAARRQMQQLTRVTCVSK